MNRRPEPLSSPSTLRPPRDRFRQAFLFEAGGLLLISPLFAWVGGFDFASSMGLLAVLSVIALAWNAGFNTVFDVAELRLTGRRADRRPTWLRALHALSFEAGLVALTLPVVVVWTGMGWLAALLADIGLAFTYAVYAFLFHLLYDRCFPIHSE